LRDALFLQTALGAHALTLDGDRPALVSGLEKTQARTEHADSQQSQDLTHGSFSLRNCAVNSMTNQSRQATAAKPPAPVHPSLNHPPGTATTAISRNPNETFDSVRGL